jgi:hypothetical protein
LDELMAKANRLRTERGCFTYEEEMSGIGIPNLPAMIHEAKRKRARERLAAGRCPVHNVALIERGNEEYCPECEDIRDGKNY